MNFKTDVFYTRVLKSYFDRSKTVALLLWMLVNAFLLMNNGMLTTGEAGKYIDQANQFVSTGKPAASNYWLYLTQLFLLSFCIKFKIGFWFALVVQLCFNLVATLSFYGLLVGLFERKNIALTGTIILLLSWPYQQFNVFLQTESLFYSFTLIFSCYLLRIKRFHVKNLLGIVLWIAIIIVTRPTGILFLPAAFIYLFFIFFKRMGAKKRLALFISISLLFLYILDKAMGSGGELDFMLPFRGEDIICGVPTSPALKSITTVAAGNSLYGLLYYITHNFGQFGRLAWLRTLAFFGLYRDYYSNRHNIYLIAYFYSLHVMGFLGIIVLLKKHVYELLYFLSIIFLTWLTVILTCDDWHNRFYLAIVPYIIVLGMGFLSQFYKKTAAH